MGRLARGCVGEVGVGSGRGRVGRSERGSATLQVLFASVLLLAVFGVAILWSAISTARHKVSAAADLTALSAAQALNAPTAGLTTPSGVPGAAGDRASGASVVATTQGVLGVSSVEACVVAGRVAVRNGVRLTGCEVVADAVSVEVSVDVDLRVVRAPLTASARAGPV